jgi:nucleotide-binding universal stress UspA family protein
VTSASQEGGGDSDHAVPRVVVGVDGSSDSMHALVWAAAEARLRGAVLDVVHVDFMRQEALNAFAPDLLTEELTVLDRAVGRAQALEPGVVVKGRICEPPAAKALIEASEGAEMLVVGSRGLSAMKQLTMGSVSSECAHHARCPVVIIRPLASRSSTEPPGTTGAGRLAVEDAAGNTTGSG